MNSKQFIMHGVNAVGTGATAFGKSGIEIGRAHV
jgi:hypothetical protein